VSRQNPARTPTDPAQPALLPTARTSPRVPPYSESVADEGGFPKGIGSPATQALLAAGYTDLKQLAGVPAAELAKLHGMGPKALGRLREALEERGQSLG
jgi:predicted flap endonuclease-1-like 5' DNA nuclease